MKPSGYDKEISFIIYDGITNSVFHSQVLTPILQILDEIGDLEITLVSFERTKIPDDVLQKIIPAHDRLHLVLCQKMPFFGKLSLLFGVRQLMRLYRKLRADHIIARGPLAGWIAMMTVRKLAHIVSRPYRQMALYYFARLTIQARGLAAEEFRFACERQAVGLFKRLMWRVRYRAYLSIEYDVYRQRDAEDFPQDVMIESVSGALKDYLLQNFDADPARIVVSRYDVPKPLPKEYVGAKRISMREGLGIPADWYVYCYSGSAQPWQCIDEMIAYFKERLGQNQNVFFLVLSKDKMIFEQKFSKANISANHFAVFSVHPDDIYHYLCAGNAGMLFREKDPINWVSRPTKMLEYQAVGLEVIHNNNVGCLVERSGI